MQCKCSATVNRPAANPCSWGMTLSLFYFSFWLVMRGASFVRPTALHRGFVNIWLFALGWGLQVLAAVIEDRMHVGALYFAAFLQSGVFLSLLVSLLEQFALNSKRDFAMQLHDAHHARDHSAYEASAPLNQEADTNNTGHQDSDDEEGSNSGSPTEETPLRSGEQDYGTNDQPTFASTYRRSASEDSHPAPKIRGYPPYPHEQSWSGRLPTWTWIIQFLLLAPVPILLLGNLGLVAMSSLSMTGTDGGSLLTPLMAVGLTSILLLLPLSPFMHRITYHVPTVLFLVFAITFVYNLVAFPFSINHRFKFYFQQVIDLDNGTNIVSLSGIEEYIRPVIDSLPVAAGQKIGCQSSDSRPDLAECRYDASSLPPVLVVGKQPFELMNVTISRSVDGTAANVLLDALDTRTCYMDLSEPIYGFSVEGGGERDPRFGSFPPDGLQHLQVWRRDWDKSWNVTLQLTKSGNSAKSSDTSDAVEIWERDELEARTETELARRAEPLEVRVRCAWSDANKPSTIPAFHELRKYMPTWSVATKKTVGLVEVTKTFTVPS